MEARDALQSSLKRHKSSGETHGDGGVEIIDRISNLPEAILQYILSFLVTREVVQTSILSRRWRYLWTSMPYLDFNQMQFPLSSETRHSSAAKRKFIDFIKWVLIFRDGSNIQRFRLFCFGCDQSAIDSLIHVVAKRNVQELDLTNLTLGSFGLPRCLVTCESLMVLKLNLYYRVLELPASMSFRRLTTLHLVSVKFSGDGLVQELFSSCPLLENLTMIRCILKHLRVLDISAANLKNLTISNISLGLYGGDGFCKSELRVSAPNLISFNYIGPVAHDYSLQNLSTLVNAFVRIIDGFVPHMSNEERGYRMSKMINGFYNAKVLTLSLVFLENLFHVIGKPGCFPTLFYNLKTLKLMPGVEKCHMQVIIILLKCSPNLEALFIDFEETSEWENYWKSPDEDVTCLTYHLKTVEIRDSEGQENELEFVKFLLKSGRVLEKMTISWSTYLEEQMEITQKVLAFPKASSSIAISFP